MPLELSLVQWVFIGLGLLILLPNLMGWFSKVKDLIVKPHTPNPRPDAVRDEQCLTDIVSKWECLHDACRDAKLELACTKIEEVFPLLCCIKELGIPDEVETI